MRPDWPTLDVSKLGDDFQSWRDGLAYPVQKALRSLRVMTDAGLTLADNQAAAIVTFGAKTPLVHGVEYAFKSPTFRPLGFTPLASMDAGGNIALPVLGLPQINYNRADKKDGWFGLTLSYAPPVGYIALVKSAVQTVTNGVLSNIAWDVETQKSGSLTHSNSTNNERIVCAVSGVVEFVFQSGWVTYAGTSQFITAYSSKNGVSSGAGSRRGFSRGGDSATGQISGSNSAALWEVSAGDYLAAIVAQANTGALSRDLAGNTSSECALQARYVDVLPGYSAIVTGILWGG